MDLRIKQKQTNKLMEDGFYFDMKGNVYEYSYSPMAGHFDHDPKQLRIRKDLFVELIKD